MLISEKGAKKAALYRAASHMRSADSVVANQSTGDMTIYCLKQQAPESGYVNTSNVEYLDNTNKNVKDTTASHTQRKRLWFDK